MRLRIRSIDSKETLKIETPNPSSFQNLKDAIAIKTTFPSETLHLSLNRKDEIVASPTDPLTSIGIASGDLIYYTRNSNVFSPSLPLQQPPIQPPVPQVSIPKATLVSDKLSDSIAKQSSLEAPNVGNQEVTGQQDKTLTLESYENMVIDGNQYAIGQEDEILAHGSSENMEIVGNQEHETLESSENVESAENSDVLFKNLSSVPCFLQKVYREEVGNGNTYGDYKLLIIAVHAVFLESGFVCFDSTTQKKIDGFCLPAGWAMKPSLSVQYTVPGVSDGEHKALERVELKFQTMRNFVCVYGLSRKNPVKFFRLDALRFVPSTKSVCMLNAVDESSKSFHEKEVFELWKIAKDGLALPLLIDICDAAGLEPPPCFMRLPTDLKLKILMLLPGMDVAKVACVSSELRYLSSSDDIWKQKYMEEFALSGVGEIPTDQWKAKYVISREQMKRKRRVRPRSSYPLLVPNPPLRREPRWFPFPGINGGDFDRFPQPYGSNTNPLFPFPPARRNFTRTCNFGGFDA